ncbi:hypothetical protein VTO42DRAFT_2658 [Malbranchea cinnamomea]
MAKMPVKSLADCASQMVHFSFFFRAFRYFISSSFSRPASLVCVCTSKVFPIQQQGTVASFISALVMCSSG